MMATNHDDQLGEIYPTRLNELKCTSAFSVHVFIAVAIIRVIRSTMVKIKHLKFKRGTLSLCFYI